MPDNDNEFGLTLGTTDEWDVAPIYATDVNSQDFKELLVRLYQNLSNISSVINLKESAYYDTRQFVTGQQYFPNPNTNSSTSSSPDFRPVFRLVVDFGQLPNGPVLATKSVPHRLAFNSGFSFTHVYGAATDTTGLTAISLPYASPTLANNIQVDVTATDVIVTVGATVDRSNYNKCTIVLEFMKW